MPTRNFIGLWGMICVSLATRVLAADAPSLETAFALTPTQKDVEYEPAPPASQLKQCKVELETKGKSSGWVVTGPEGQVMRKFISTSGKTVDQWRYYNHGIEVYREYDTNKDNRADTFRWLNLGGSRWGQDTNGDGTIDVWKSLSASEASREAIQAVTSGNYEALQALLITADDLKTLGIDKQIATKLLAQVNEAPKKSKSMLAKSKVLNAQSKWMKFDAAMPGTIPKDDGKATDDLQVYENAMVIVETGKSSGLVQIGEMIRVGEVWKLTQAPLPIEGKEDVLAGGLLMQPVLAENTASVANAPSPEMQKLIDELLKLDEKPPAPTASGDVLKKYINQRAELLMKLYHQAGSDEEKVQYMKQLIDGLSSMIQTGAYPEGLPKLKNLEAELKKGGNKSPLAAYASYRLIFADYSVNVNQAKDEERANVQKEWLKSLETYISDYPQSDDTADAMLQLAINDEFLGKQKEASDWYQRIVSEKAKSPAAKKAEGALTRLSLKGKPMVVAGPGLQGGTIDSSKYQGRAAVLIVYWATWSPQSTEDLPDLRAFYQQYHDRGFEIIGIPLDMSKEPIPPYLSKHKVSWPQIYQPGGVESPLAVQYGVFSPPVMILLDKSGKVVSRNTSVAELKNVLPQLFKEK